MKKLGNSMQALKKGNINIRIKIFTIFTIFTLFTLSTGFAQNTKTYDYATQFMYAQMMSESIQNGQRVVLPDTEMYWYDSLVLVLYPDSSICTESMYRHGKRYVYTEYYANGQIRSLRGSTEKEVGPNDRGGSFPFYYGKYCYLYGFKIYERTHMHYNYDGSVAWITFNGYFDRKRVRIDVEFVGGGIYDARIYDRRNRLIQEMTWDDRMGTWSSPAVNHVRKNLTSKQRKRIREWKKEQQKN